MGRLCSGTSAVFTLALLGGLTLLAPAGCGGGDESSGDGSGTGGASSDAGSDADTDADTDGGQPTNCNHDGVVQAPEECDDGNDDPNDGCNNECSFSCRKDSNCDDGDPCNGAEACDLATHTCGSPGQAANGTSCGTDQVCHDGVCSDVKCGDGFVDQGEECDDGNVTPGDGCDSCKFSCLSTDATRNCTSTSECVEDGTCDDGAHTCAPGANKANGTACTGGTCQDGACKSAACGDGHLDSGEDCDFGAGNGADTGCEVNCKFSCTKTPESCVTGDPCGGANTCTTVTVSGATGQACQTGTPLGNGASCGSSGQTCQGGVCTAASCGNGVKDAGEDCDLGANNSAANGCLPGSCKFACNSAADCADGNSCNGTESCTTGSSSGQTVKKCAAGTNAASCTACAGGGVCQSGACASSTCGDGCVDSTKGEQCEPPGTATCDAQCHTIAAAACGNGTREAGEQCDDGNTTNLDGCDATCKFEQDHRVTYLKMQWGKDSGAGAYCTANALGSAIKSAAQGQLQTALDDGVADGSISVLAQFLDLDDLSGTADPAVRVGFMSGTPLLPGGVTYPGGSGATTDLDWWYTADPLSLDANRRPTGTLSGSIAGSLLSVGPGNITLTISISGSPAPLQISQGKVQVKLGSTSTPKTSTGNPPGHLASEHLDPALTSFQTGGTQNDNGAGKLCGNVSAYSMSKVMLTDGITGVCSAYKANNSLLDLIVGGCRVLVVVEAVAATQPDQSDPAKLPAGTTPPYKLSAGSNKQVNGCKDKNGKTVPLDACLQAAAYSSYFKLATDRVIIK